MIPKAERDADRAICEAAPDNLARMVDECGRVDLVSENTGHFGYDPIAVGVSAEFAGFAIAARDRLPLYIAALDEMDRRIKAVDALMKKYENEGSASAVAQEYDHANNLFERRDALFAALRILLRNPCTLCNGAGILQNPEDGWRPGLVLSPAAEACVRAAFAREPATLPAEKWVTCKRCGGTTEAT